MEWYKRGTLVASGRTRRTLQNMKFWSNDRSLHLAGLTIGPAEETKHFKFIGTTGTGKSTAITELLDGALVRGDRAIIADPDGGYLARFHDRHRGDPPSVPAGTRHRSPPGPPCTSRQSAEKRTRRSPCHFRCSA